MQLKFSDKMDRTLGKNWIGLQSYPYTLFTVFKWFSFPYVLTSFSHISRWWQKIVLFIEKVISSDHWNHTTIPDDSETETEVWFEFLEAFISSSPRRQFFVKFQKFPIHTKSFHEKQENSLECYIPFHPRKFLFHWSGGVVILSLSLPSHSMRITTKTVFILFLVERIQISILLLSWKLWKLWIFQERKHFKTLTLSRSEEKRSSLLVKWDTCYVGPFPYATQQV